MKQYSFKTKLAVALLASTALLSAGAMTATAAQSAGQSSAAAPAASATQQGFTFKVSDHAATALGGVTAARMALMQWSGNRATTILTQVKDTLANAKDGLNKATLVKYGKADKASEKLLTDTMYYPVGISTDTFESFTAANNQQAPAAQAGNLPSETTAQVKATEQVYGTGTGGSAHQAGANGPQIAQNSAAPGGTQAQPKETVDTAVLVALLPRDATVHAIDTALTQIKKGDFAAADMALSSINSSILYGSMNHQASEPVSS